MTMQDVYDVTQETIDLIDYADGVVRHSSEAPKQPPQDGPVYVVAGRWSVPHTEANKDSLIKMLKQFSKHYIFQAEDTKSNPHYQIYANLKNKVRPKTFAISLNEEFKGINFQHASENGKTRLKTYCMKEETRVAGPWSDAKIYRGKDLPKKLFPWQEQLKEFLLEEADDRTILWIYDPKGATGKSKFYKYMGVKHEACLLSYANAKDLLNLVYTSNDAGIYLFDLTRAKPTEFSSNDLYSAIEQIKNGVIINTKYQTGRKFIDPPHVVCFANVLPEEKKLSLDRWKIFEIRDNGLYKK